MRCPREDPAPQRWLVLPGLACPASSFDAVRRELRRSGAPVELDVLDAWTNPFLETGPGAALAARRYDGVVGHSLGGLAALEHLLEPPPGVRVGQLVLLDPTTPCEVGPGPVVRRLLERWVPRVVRWAGAAGLLRAVGSLLDKWWPVEAGDASSSTGTDVWQRWWRENVAGWDRARRVGHGLRGARSHAPVTLLVAARATRREGRTQAALARSLRTAVVRVPASGHLVMRDRPDVVAEVIARLARSPQAPVELDG